MGTQWVTPEKMGDTSAPGSWQPGFPHRVLAACEPGGVVGAPRNLWETGGTTPRPGRGVDAPNCHLPLFTRPTAPSPSQGIQPLRAAGRAKSWAPRTHPQSRPGWVPDALETLALSLQVTESHPCSHHLTSHRRIGRSWREGGGLEGAAHRRLGCICTFLCINHRQLLPPLECMLARAHAQTPSEPKRNSPYFIQICRGRWNELSTPPSC